MLNIFKKKIKPSRKLLLEFLADTHKEYSKNGKGAIILKNENEALINIDGPEPFLRNFSNIYYLVKILKLLGLKISNRNEIINYLEKQKNEDGLYHFSKGINLSETIEFLEIFKELDYKPENNKLIDLVKEYENKDSKIYKKYAKELSYLQYYYYIVFLAKYFDINEINIKKIAEHIKIYKQPEGYYHGKKLINSRYNSFKSGDTNFAYEIFKIAGYKREAEDIKEFFKTLLKPGFYYYDLDFNEIIFLRIPGILFQLERFDGKFPNETKEDILKEVEKSWEGNCFYLIYENKKDKKQGNDIEYQYYPLAVLNILGGKELINSFLDN